MNEEKRNELCERIFMTLVEETGGDGADILIILKRALIATVQSLSKTDGIEPELVNRTYETLAHEFLTEALKTFADRQEITIINN